MTNPTRSVHTGYWRVSFSNYFPEFETQATWHTCPVLESLWLEKVFAHSRKREKRLLLTADLRTIHKEQQWSKDSNRPTHIQKKGNESQNYSLSDRLLTLPQVCCDHDHQLPNLRRESRRHKICVFLNHCSVDCYEDRFSNAAFFW